MSGQLLKASSDALQEMYPAQLQQIRAGLLLAVCGRVSQVNETSWQVKGQELNKDGMFYTYNVKIEDNILTCNCDFNHPVAAPPIADFLGYYCKHACKHIASVLICRQASINGIYPAQSSLYDQVIDLVAAQHLPAPKEAWFLPGTKIKLVRKDVGGKDTVLLATGFKYSLPLVSWVTNPATNRGMWILKSDSFGIYSKFIFDVTGKKVLARMEQAEL